MSSVKLKNLFTHSLNDASGWMNATYSTQHSKYGSGCMMMTANSGSAEVVFYTSDTILHNQTHKYYCRVETFQETKVGSTDIYWPEAEPNFLNNISGPANTWVVVSAVNTRSNWTTHSDRLRFDFNNSRVAGQMWFDGALLIDLTECFGAGKEPTKEWLDSNIPWFLGEYIYMEKPDPLTGVSCEQVRENLVKFSWNRSPEDVDFYRVYLDSAKVRDVSDPLPLFEFPFSNESLTSAMIIFSEIGDMFYELTIPLRKETTLSVTAVKDNKESDKASLRVYYDRVPKFEVISILPNPAIISDKIKMEAKVSVNETFNVTKI